MLRQAPVGSQKGRGKRTGSPWVSLPNPGPRVEISGLVELSEDRRTIVKALRIDGVWYDIEIDSPPGLSLESYRSMVPKIQMIWARIAEQALLPNPSSTLKMECSYNCNTERASVFTISNRGKEDITDSISFDVQELKEELGESPEIAESYFGNSDRCTVHAVMKYVNNELMKPSSILRPASESNSSDFLASAPTTPQKAKTTPTSTPTHSRKPPSPRKLRKPPPLFIPPPSSDELLPAPTPTSEQVLKPMRLAAVEALRESVQRVIHTARRAEHCLSRN